MAYGTLSSTIKNHYNKVSYTLKEEEYSGIHIFKTNPTTETVSPAVYTNGNKKHLGSMNPNGISASTVMAKTNGNVMQSTGSGGTSFYGIYYADGQLYQHGASCVEGDIACDFRTYPCFCIKNDDSATIRWFTSNYKFSIALPYCRAIISGSIALVFDGKSVFESSVESDDGHVIYNPNNPSDPNCHFRNELANNSVTWSCARTFLGHKTDGSFLLVVCEEIDLYVGAKLMVDLGCDYAINLDGSSPSQMRVASGYLNNVPGVSAGKVTQTGSDSYYYGTAIAAHTV